MSLRDDLRARYGNAQLRLPAEVRGIMKRNADDPAATGLAGRAVGVGARAPQFTRQRSLPDASRRPHTHAQP